MKSSVYTAVERHIPTLCALWHKNSTATTLNGQEIKRVAKALFALQRGLTGQRELAGASYMQDPAYVGAYLLYYWPVSYQQILFAAQGNDCLKRAVRKKTVRILDVGSGPAPASAALCDFFSSLGIFATVTLVDSSPHALGLAHKLFHTDFCNTPLKTFTYTFVKETQQAEWEDETYDVIVVSHLLNELWNNEPDFLLRRAALLRRLAKLLSPNGILYVVEPSTLSCSRNLIALRTTLIEENMQILSPCPAQSGKCPALLQGEKATCHAEIAWKPPKLVEALAREAGLVRSSVKMSFFIFKKSQEKKDALPKNQHEGAVVTSCAMVNKAARVRFLLCNGTERFALSAKKDDRIAQEKGFFGLSRYDSVYIKNAPVRGTSGETPAYSIDAHTDLRIQRFLAY